MISLRTLTAAAVLVLAAAPATTWAQDLSAAPAKTENGRINFAAATQGAPIYAGAPVAVSGEGFQPGQTVRVLYGAEALLPQALTADAEGKLTAQLTLPANAAVGIHPVVVITEGPYSAQVVDLRVSPQVPLSGEDRFQIERAAVTRGLYQSAYSPKNDAVFVTSAVGRPPVTVSELLRLDADSLEVEARITPAAAPQRPGRDGQTGPGGVFAVYGVGVDDEHDNVWVTQTRQNTVAVYRQSDLSLVRQFDPETVNHARDVVIDDNLNKAFVSATFQPEIVVFDTTSPEVKSRIIIASGVRGGTFSAASLSMDRAAHRLYVVSNSTNEVAVIDTRTDQVMHVFPVPGARGSIGVSHDPQTHRIYVASQTSDNLVVLDGETGAVVSDTPVGAGALNVWFDPARREAFVINRGANTVTVVDENGQIIANLGPAPQANHVAGGAEGVAYVVTKGRAGDEDADSIWRIQPSR